MDLWWGERPDERMNSQDILEDGGKAAQGCTGLS